VTIDSIMRQSGLLLERHPGKRRHRIHEGRIITLHRNTRRCSDIFEIPSWSDEVVRVAFSMGCCDGEAIDYIGTTAGVSGQMNRDVMVDSVERCFGSLDCLRRPNQWLSDNGSTDTVHETVVMVHVLSLMPCKPPRVLGPESNGMAEAFVKRF